jgi:hypothetical protein
VGKPKPQGHIGGGLALKKGANLDGISGNKKKGLDVIDIDDDNAFREGEDSDEEERRLMKERKQQQAEF